MQTSLNYCNFFYLLLFPSLGVMWSDKTPDVVREKLSLNSCDYRYKKVRFTNASGDLGRSLLDLGDGRKESKPRLLEILLEKNRPRYSRYSLRKILQISKSWNAVSAAAAALCWNFGVIPFCCAGTHRYGRQFRFYLRLAHPYAIHR